MKETLKKVIKPLLRQYRDEFGKDALRELIAETRTDKPKYICSVELGGYRSKHRLNKYIQGAKFTDEGFLLILGDDPVPVDGLLYGILGEFLAFDDLVIPYAYKRYSTYQRRLDESEEASSDGC